MSLVGTHVPTPQHRQPSPQHRQPSPQHHEPSHSQASISKNCVGSHCSQNNFLRRKREIVDAINSLAEDVLQVEKAERRKREVVAKLLDEALKIAEEEAAVEEVNSRANVENIDENSEANVGDLDEGNSRRKRDIISVINESS